MITSEQFPRIADKIEHLINAEMPTEEVDELEEYVRLLKIDADNMPNKHDLFRRGQQVAYSHCWFTFNRMVEKFRNCMSSSEKPNNCRGWADLDDEIDK